VITEQRGRIGEFIRIRNATSRKILRALVTGEGELVIGEFATNARQKDQSR
jgi:flagella basal body P-ring formation protein FlgA